MAVYDYKCVSDLHTLTAYLSDLSCNLLRSTHAVRPDSFWRVSGRYIDSMLICQVDRS